MQSSTGKRIRELFSQQVSCSQIMLVLPAEQRGEAPNAGLVQALGGLGGGMGAGRACGALTGGACLLAAQAGHAGAGTLESKQRLKAMTAELVAWFEAEFGSIDCRDLVAPERPARLDFCPLCVDKTYAKCMAILQKHDASVGE